MVKKNSVIAIFMMCLIILVACGKNNTSNEILEREMSYDLGTLACSEIDFKIDVSMPKPLPESENHGDDRLINFYQPCKGKLDNIPVELMQLVGENEVETWIANNSDLDIAHSRIGEYANLYSFIKTFDISYTQTCEALKGYLTADYLPEELAISQEDIDILYSGNEAAIVKHFSSDFSIVIGENVYSPQWVYLHTIEDCINVGITKEMILEKIDRYNMMPLSANAISAFEDKLSLLSKEKIEFDIDLIEENWGELIYDFEGYYLLVDGEQLDVEWLSTHTIQDYADKGITTNMLENILSNMEPYSESDEYQWIESCLKRME